MTPNIKVCSNHFVLGRPYGLNPHPCLYMRGYDDAASHKENYEVQNIIAKPQEMRSGKKRRKSTEENSQQKKKTCRKQLILEDIKEAAVSTDHNYIQVTTDHTTSEAVESDQSDISLEHVEEPETYSSYSLHDMREEHLYGRTEDISNINSLACTCTARCNFCKMQYKKIEEENSRLRLEIEMLKKSSEPQEEPALRSTKYNIADIKERDHLVSLHTGVPSYALFIWILNLVLPKIPHMQYFRGAQSETPKSYQIKNTKKPGPPRLLSPANELFMVLMKLRLNLPEEFLGYLFGTCTSLVSQVLSTWLPLLALELSPLLYWPEQEELTLYYPDCFKKYNNVRAIIDCTEVPIQRPSLAKANSQIYSSYKGRPTVKVLVACTPAGTVSFLSKSSGGSMSDKELVKRSGIIDKFDPGDTLLADRGFNIQELLLMTGVKLAIPPFLRGKKQFSLQDDQKTKTVANARIHIERVIGRMKDFHIMKSELPLDMFDLFDHMVTVVAALINLQPPIVPLESR